MERKSGGWRGSYKTTGPTRVVYSQENSYYSEVCYSKRVEKKVSTKEVNKTNKLFAPKKVYKFPDNVKYRIFLNKASNFLHDIIGIILSCICKLLLFSFLPSKIII